MTLADEPTTAEMRPSQVVGKGTVPDLARMQDVRWRGWRRR
jgi:hypothetical protein